MTLIYTKLSSEGAAIISDIMLTSDQPAPERKSMWLVGEGNIDESKYSTVGHMQKTILISRRCLFQWAGQMVVAQSIYNFIKSHIGMSFENIEKLLEQEYSSKDLKAVAFSIIRIKSGKIEFFSHDGDHTSRGSTMTWAAGSGTYLIDPKNHPADKTFSETKDGDEIIDDEFADILIRLYNGEAGAYVYDPYRAGGWYEITVIKDGLFHKVPYIVCYYDLDELERTGNLEPTLAIFSRYMQDRLLVHRVWGNNKSCIINVVPSFKSHFHREISEPDRYFLSGLHNWQIVILVTMRNGDMQVISQINQSLDIADEIEILNLANPSFLTSSETKGFLLEQLKRPIISDDMD